MLRDPREVGVGDPPALECIEERVPPLDAEARLEHAAERQVGIVHERWIRRERHQERVGRIDPHARLQPAADGRDPVRVPVVIRSRLDDRGIDIDGETSFFTDHVEARVGGVVDRRDPVLVKVPAPERHAAQHHLFPLTVHDAGGVGLKEVFRRVVGDGSFDGCAGEQEGEHRFR